ncbi:MAG: hypothetical protein U1F36_04935 [Planctomycetota bacterium]
MLTLCLALALPQDPAPARAEVLPEPQLVTARTLADHQRLDTLQRPGVVLFREDFESDDAFSHFFEVRGEEDGRAVLTRDPHLAHSGSGALQLTAPARDGASSGAGVSGWLGGDPQRRLHLRYWLKWAVDYDQGDLNHTGGCLVGVAGDDKWAGMGTAGIRPKGDDHFSASFETWIDWRRLAAPGYAFLYTYWMDMKRDRDGHFWGNLLSPEPEDRVIPRRDRWTCFELMVNANTPGAFDGELATWIDGRLYMHWQGLRLRSTAAVTLRRIGLDIYVHHARRDNRVWFDDVLVSTGYIGITDPPRESPAELRPPKRSGQ